MVLQGFRLGRRLVNLLPLVQRVDTLTHGIDGRARTFACEKNGFKCHSLSEPFTRGIELFSGSGRIFVLVCVSLGEVSFRLKISFVDVRYYETSTTTAVDVKSSI